ncbi:MAG: Aminomethyltransferase [Phycisphaerae bacterium]|nr:Aminomethyltransferase [Phycisphaerae bacterium]
MQLTPLNDLHVELGANLVDFAGWEMPILYDSIINEHRFTRQHATLFDVSHMGRLFLSGPDAEALLERLNTRPIADMKIGQCRYSHVCREDGGILDDVIVSRLHERWLVVCNASNRDKIVGWIRKHSEGRQVTLDDQTLTTAMIAIQGPDTLALAKDYLTMIDLAGIKRYHCLEGSYLGINYICARTGYTGEDGYELILPAAAGRMLAGSILNAKGALEGRIKPAGLGSRDTLRLEAGMPLYGHELSESVDSLTAGQAWAVDLNKDFIGAPVLRQLQEHGMARQLVGLHIEGKRIARQDTPVEKDGGKIGVVTSGTLSPTLDMVIAMAYVDKQFAAIDTPLQVNLRGQPIAAQVVRLPFYKRSK